MLKQQPTETDCKHISLHAPIIFFHITFEAIYCK